MKLEIGMRVLIKNDKANHKEKAGTIQKISSHLPDFRGERAFELEGDEGIGIWLKKKKEKCVHYPDLPME